MVNFNRCRPRDPSLVTRQVQSKELSDKYITHMKCKGSQSGQDCQKEPVYWFVQTYVSPNKYLDVPARINLHIGPSQHHGQMHHACLLSTMKSNVQHSIPAFTRSVTVRRETKPEQIR